MSTPRRRKQLFLCALASLTLLAVTDRASAQITIASGDYNDPGIWDGGAVPNDVAGTAHVNGGFTADISADIPDMNKVLVGTLGTAGTVNHSAGLVDVTNGTVAGDDNWLYVGQGTSTGTYNASGTAQMQAQRVGLGQDAGGNGSMTLSGTADLQLTQVTGNGELYVGHLNNAAVGTLTLNDDASVSRSGDAGISVGHDGDGTVTQNGNATVDVVWASVGANSGAVGTYNLNGGSLTTGNELQIGINAGSDGTFNQSGGAVNVGQWFITGRETDAVGAYHLTGGTFNVGTDMLVGDLGVGTHTQSGVSTVNVQNTFFVSNQGTSGGSSYTQDGGDVNVGLNGGGWMIVGNQAGSNGTYNLNGGNLNPRQRLIIGNETGSTGNMVVSGGVLTTGDSLVVSRHGTGDLGQTGGIINTQFVDIGGDAGTGDAVAHGRYAMFGGVLNATNDVRIGLNPNGGIFTVGMSVFEDAVINVDGSLEVSRDGDGDFLSSGSLASLNFGGNLDANSANAARLIWGSDAGGVNDINIGIGAADPSLVSVDVTGAELLVQLTDGDPGTGLPTVAQAVPGDLLLIDNHGTNPVTGLLSFNNLVDPVQLLNEGDLLIDGALGLLDGLQYRITYLGADGLGNDVILRLVPEPTSMVMLVLTVFLFGLSRRRR